VSKIGVDCLNQVSDALKASVDDGLLSEIPKKSFHHVKPGSAGGCKMQVKAAMTRQPGFDLGMLVSGVVVDNEMELHLGRGLLVNML